jgi:hypothetical protein
MKMQINKNIYNSVNPIKDIRLLLDYSNNFPELYSLDSFNIENEILVCTIKIPKETLFQDIPDIGIITVNEHNYNISKKVSGEEILEATIFEIKEIQITKKWKENPFFEYGDVNLPIGWMNEMIATLTIQMGKKNILTNFDNSDILNTIKQFRREIKLDNLL